MAVRSAEGLAAAAKLLKRRAPKLHGFTVWDVEEDEVTGSVALLITTQAAALTAVVWEGELYALRLGWPA